MNPVFGRAPGQKVKHVHMYLLLQSILSAHCRWWVTKDLRSKVRHGAYRMAGDDLIFTPSSASCEPGMPVNRTKQVKRGWASLLRLTCNASTLFKQFGRSAYCPRSTQPFTTLEFGLSFLIPLKGSLDIRTYLLVQGLEEGMDLLVLGTELLQHRRRELGLRCTTARKPDKY